MGGRADDARAAVAQRDVGAITIRAALIVCSSQIAGAGPTTLLSALAEGAVLGPTAQPKGAVATIRYEPR